MNNEYGIIISPVVTEKNNDLASQNKYVFRVSPRAGKIEIGKAVEKLCQSCGYMKKYMTSGR